MTLVRRMEPAEWREYRALRLRALADAPDAFGATHAGESALPDALWIERLARAAGSEAECPLFALHQDTRCGLAWCRLDDGDGTTAHLYQRWVAPEARGRGAGAALLQTALRWARGAGAQRLQLGVTEGDTPAARLYASFGFVRIGALEPLRDGSPLWARTMECPLGESC